MTPLGHLLTTTHSSGSWYRVPFSCCLWQAESVTFTVVQPPRHGTIERTSNGPPFQLTSTFTMEDIYQNRVRYSHDGSDSLKDRFTFTVADGANPFFIVEEGGEEVRGRDSREGGGAQQARGCLEAERDIFRQRVNPLQCSCLENPMDRGAWWGRFIESQRVGYNWSNLARMYSTRLEFCFCHLIGLGQMT